ncbi:MAG: aminopeptidase P family protein [Chloroflexi bacterium]|nr:aminopeptidase P family protein [Chloroflexota bacterium]
MNHARALALMRQCDIHALVATSPTNVLYSSDYFCWLDPLFKRYMTRPGASADLSHNFALLPLDGEPALVVPAMWAANAADCWVTDVWTHGIGEFDFSALPNGEATLLKRIRLGADYADAVDALYELLRNRGLLDGCIGIELEGLPAGVQARLREKIPHAELRDCSNLLRVIRMVKSKEELEHLERSARINVSAATNVLRGANTGMSLHELRRQYVEQITTSGATLDHFIAAPGGSGLIQVPDYRIGPADVLYVDFGCVYEHYYSDNGATLVVGDWSSEMERRYDVLRRGLERGIAELRPGTHASQVRAAMLEQLAAEGVSDCNAHGHGIGLEVRDYPIIMPDEGRRIRDNCIDVSADVVLEPDMVVNLETPLYLFGVGSLHVEQTFVITPDGCRRIDGQGETRAVRAGREMMTI